jgi:hypothetical protein
MRRAKARGGFGALQVFNGLQGGLKHEGQQEHQQGASTQQQRLSSANDYGGDGPSSCSVAGDGSPGASLGNAEGGYGDLAELLGWLQEQRHIAAEGRLGGDRRRLLVRLLGPRWATSRVV